ncbi:hypothetical protein A0H81_09434 [Grifola frondosa]|uniref:Amino acid permease/ SLC12A domain-containing protein n=1 Tax=Grifola frondosa TaxID=5627 RepID=A0A1C7M1J2_GRIFR|nr:hypothetical protein A0H81_09434 [Grifola frondosa]
MVRREHHVCLLLPRIEDARLGPQETRIPWLPATYWGMFWITIFILINGFAMLWDFNASGFLTAYIKLPIFAGLYLFWKIYKRTQFWRPQGHIDVLFDRTRERLLWEPAKAPEAIWDSLGSRCMLPSFLPFDPRMLGALTWRAKHCEVDVSALQCIESARTAPRHGQPLIDPDDDGNEEKLPHLSDRTI